MSASAGRLACADARPADAAGPPLVLLHGAGGTRAHWPAALRALPGRRVVALDLPGHGASPGPALETVAGYAREVLGSLDALGIGRAVLCGHSMGGAIALTAALEAPGRVAGLVLVATGAKLRVAPAILALTADPAALQAGADAMAAGAFGPGAAPALREAFARELRATAPGVAHGDFRACDAFDAMARLGEVRVPALVVCGTEDRLTPPKYGGLLAERIAGARLELVPGAGHMVMLEEPGRVAAAIEAFLAALAHAGGGP